MCGMCNPQNTILVVPNISNRYFDATAAFLVLIHGNWNKCQQAAIPTKNIKKRSKYLYEISIQTQKWRLVSMNRDGYKIKSPWIK